MRINAHSIYFSYEEAFQILHDRNLYLWEQVLDLLSDAAEESYELTPVEEREGDFVTGNGVEFGETELFWSNQDLDPCDKWEEWNEEVGQK